MQKGDKFFNYITKGALGQSTASQNSTTSKKKKKTKTESRREDLANTSDNQVGSSNYYASRMVQEQQNALKRLDEQRSNAGYSTYKRDDGYNSSNVYDSRDSYNSTRNRYRRAYEGQLLKNGVSALFGNQDAKDKIAIAKSDRDLSKQEAENAKDKVDEYEQQQYLAEQQKKLDAIYDYYDDNYYKNNEYSGNIKSSLGEQVQKVAEAKSNSDALGGQRNLLQRMNNYNIQSGNQASLNDSYNVQATDEAVKASQEYNTEYSKLKAMVDEYNKTHKGSKVSADDLINMYNSTEQREKNNESIQKQTSLYNENGSNQANKLTTGASGNYEDNIVDKLLKKTDVASHLSNAQQNALNAVTMEGVRVLSSPDDAVAGLASGLAQKVKGQYSDEYTYANQLADLRNTIKTTNEQNAVELGNNTGVVKKVNDQLKKAGIENPIKDVVDIQDNGDLYFMNNKVGNLYSTIYDGIDQALENAYIGNLTSGLGGGVMNVVGATTAENFATKALSNMIISGADFNDELNELKNQGTTFDDAIKEASKDAFNNFATEMIGGEFMLKWMPEGATKNIMAEVLEEWMGNTADRIGDLTINRKDGDLLKQYNDYIDSGMTKGQAVALLIKKAIADDMYSALAVSLSMVGATTSSNIRNTLANNTENSQNKSLGKSIQADQDTLNSVLNLASVAGKDDVDIRKDLSKLTSSKNISDKDVGALTQKLFSKIDTEFRATESQDDLQQTYEKYKDSVSGQLQSRLASSYLYRSRELTQNENQATKKENSKKSAKLKSQLLQADNNDYEMEDTSDIEEEIKKLDNPTTSTTLSTPVNVHLSNGGVAQITSIEGKGNSIEYKTEDGQTYTDGEILGAVSQKEQDALKVVKDKDYSGGAKKEFVKGANLTSDLGSFTSASDIAYSTGLSGSYDSFDDFYKSADENTKQLLDGQSKNYLSNMFAYGYVQGYENGKSKYGNGYIHSANKRKQQAKELDELVNKKGKKQYVSITESAKKNLSNTQVSQIKFIKEFKKHTKLSGLDVIVADASIASEKEVLSGYQQGKKMVLFLNGYQKNATLAYYGHELTHYLDKNSNIQYALYHTFVIEHLKSKGEDEYERLLQKYADAYGFDLSTKQGMYDVEREMVADNSMAICTNKEAMLSLARTNNKLVNAILEFFENVINDLNAFREQLTAQSEVYSSVHQEEEYLKECAKLLRNCLDEVKEETTKDNSKSYSKSTSKYSLETIQDVNQSLTMSEAKQMVQDAFKLNELKGWYDNKYKNGDEWLKGEGVDEATMYIENGSSTINAMYISPNQYKDGDEWYGWYEDYSTEDVLNAYLKGTLIGKPNQSAQRLDTTQSIETNDKRFYAPKDIKQAKAKYKLANEKITNDNREKVMKARADILIYAHNEGAIETLGITQQELNKKLRSWSGYSTKALDASNRINKGVAFNNRWTGIENCAWINRASVTEKQLNSLVKGLKGKSTDYERHYVAETMLALDTHIDWSWLTINFDRERLKDYNRGIKKRTASGVYMNDSREILVGDHTNSVIHEMGHSLDYQWCRELSKYDMPLTDLVQRYSDKSEINDDEDVIKFLNNFEIFIRDITKSADRTSEYTLEPTEVFARFTDKFVNWTASLSNKYSPYDDNWYSDKFTTSQFIEFAHLLQEKALIDSKNMEVKYAKNTGNSIQNSNEKEYNNVEKGFTTDEENEFRRIQETGSNLTAKDLGLLYAGDKSGIREVRKSITSLLQRRLRSISSSDSNRVTTLVNNVVNKNIDLIQVDGDLFHDAFELNHYYMKNAGTVDVWDKDHYKNGKSYLSDDGLSGFYLTEDGDFESLFNNSGLPDFLYTIAPVIKGNCKTLDCFQNNQQNLATMYEEAFGFKTASVLGFNKQILIDDYGQEYADNFVKRFGEAPVHFMVYTDKDVEVKYFDKDDWDGANDYRNSFIEDNQDDVIRYSKFTTQNGDEISLIEKRIEVPKGVKFHTYIEDEIKKHIGEYYKIFEDNEIVYIGDDLPKEYTQSKYTKSISKSKLQNIKNNAINNFGELLEISKIDDVEINLKPKHNKDAKNGWYYYKAYLGYPKYDENQDIVDVDVYSAILAIRHDEDEKKYLYDIVYIKNKGLPQITNTDKVNMIITLAQGKQGIPYGNNVSQDENKSNTQNSNDNKKYAKSTGDYEYQSNYAVMTDERIDTLIDESGAGLNRPDYARTWITSISPTDFLDLTTGTDSREYFDNNVGGDYGVQKGYDYESELKNNKQTPRLLINLQTGQVIGHDGRHRVRALEKNGIESVEIIVEFYDDGLVKRMNGSDPAETLRFVDVLPQDLYNKLDSESTTIITKDYIRNPNFRTKVVTLEDVMPLNQSYRDRIKETYGASSNSDANIKYAKSTGNTGIHYGDLGKSRSDDLVGQGGRGTGAFGYGTYFLGNKLVEDDDYKYYTNRPEHMVNFDNYNLYKVRNTDDGYDLHSALKQINDIEYDVKYLGKDIFDAEIAGTFRSEMSKKYDVDRNGLIEDVDDIKDWNKYNQDKLKARIKQLQDWGVNFLTKSQYKDEKFIDDGWYTLDEQYADYVKELYKEQETNQWDLYRSTDELVFELNRAFGYSQEDKIIQALKDTYQYYLDNKENKRNWVRGLDSLSTFFMKQMGYDGVDVRNTGLDNTGFGSVIYNLNPEDIVYAKSTENTDTNEDLADTNDLLESVIDSVRNANINVNDIDIDKFAKSIKQSYGSRMKTQELSGMLRDFYDYLATEENPNMWYANLMAKNIADAIISDSNQKVKTDYDDIYEYIRANTFTIPEDVRNELADEYDGWGKAKSTIARGLKIRNSADKSLEQLYTELQDKFPDAFPDTENGADMLVQIGQVYELAKPQIQNTYQDGKVKGKYTTQQFENIIASKLFTKFLSDETLADNIDALSSNEKLSLFDIRQELEQEEDLLRQQYAEQNESALQDLRDKVLLKENNKREQAEISALKKKILKIKQQMDKKLLNPTESSYVPRELVQAVADVCDMLNSAQYRYKNGNLKASFTYTNKNGKEVNVNPLGTLDRLSVKYQALKNDPDYDYSSAYAEDVMQKINDLKEKFQDKQIASLSRAELQDLYETLKEIAKGINDAKRLINSSIKKQTHEASTQLMYEVDKTAGSRNFVRGTMDFEHMSPKRYANILSEGQEDAIINTLFRELNDGQRDKDRKVMEFQKPFNELIDDNKKYKKFREKLIETNLTDVNGNPVYLTEDYICEIIMDAQREQGFSHLQGGGFRVVNLKKMLSIKDRKQLRDDNVDIMGSVVEGLTLKDIEGLYDLVSDYGKEWMKRAHYFFDEQSKKEVNKTSFILKGYKLAQDENYIRLLVDPNTTAQDIEGLVMDKSIENAGFTKQLVKGANNRLIITGLSNVVDTHIDSVTDYSCLAIPIRNFNKIFNGATLKKQNIVKIADEYRMMGQDVPENLVEEYNFLNSKGRNQYSVKEALNTKWAFSEKYNPVKYFENVLKDLQGVSREKSSFYSDLFNKMMSNEISATFIGNMSIVLKQSASYPTAVSKLSSASLLAGMPHFFGFNDDEIDAHTGAHYRRRQGMSTQELGDYTRTKKIKSKKLSRFEPAKWIQAMDVATTRALWYACKAEVKHQGVQVGTQEYWNKVTTLYEDVIEDTQPEYDVLHKPEILKSKDMISRTFSLFQTQPLQNAGIIYDALRDVHWQKKYAKQNGQEGKQKVHQAKVKFTKAVWSQIAQAMVFASFSLIAKALFHKWDNYKDDDDKLTASSIRKQWGKESFETFMSAWFPIVNSIIWDVTDRIISAQKTGTLSDYDYVENLGIGAINDIMQSLASLANSGLRQINGEADEGELKSAFLTFAKQASSLVGIPANNISNWWNGIKSYAMEIKDDTLGFGEYDADADADDYYEKLVQYISSGETNKADTMKSKLADMGKSDDDIQTGIKRALMNTDQDIARAGIAYASGDEDTWFDILQSYVSQGYDAFTIKGAIKSYANYIKYAKQAQEENDSDSLKSSLKRLKASGYDDDLIQQAIDNYNYVAEEESESASSIYTAEDVINAINNNSADDAKTMIDSLIDVKVQNNDDKYKTDAEKRKSAISSVMSSIYSQYANQYIDNGLTGLDSIEDKIRKLPSDYASVDDFEENLKTKLNGIYKDDYLYGNNDAKSNAKSKLMSTGLYTKKDFTSWEVEKYNTDAMNTAFKGGKEDTRTYVKNRINAKVANGMDKDSAETGLKQSISNEYKQAYLEGNADTRGKIVQYMTWTGIYGSKTDVLNYIKEKWLSKTK